MLQRRKMLKNIHKYHTGSTEKIYVIVIWKRDRLTQMFELMLYLKIKYIWRDCVDLSPCIVLFSYIFFFWFVGFHLLSKMKNNSKIITVCAYVYGWNWSFIFTAYKHPWCICNFFKIEFHWIVSRVKSKPLLFHWSWFFKCPTLKILKRHTRYDLPGPLDQKTVCIAENGFIWTLNDNE